MKKLIILFLLLFCSTCFGDTYTSHQKPNTDSTLDIGTSTFLWRYIYGDSFTDGTALWDASSLTGFTSIFGTTLTDGTFIVSGGVISAGIWNGTAIDISDYTNLAAGTNITLSDDTLNVDDVFIKLDGDTTGAMSEDLNLDDGTFVISYDDNKVGIGTTNPGAKLEVAGDMLFTGTSSGLPFGEISVVSNAVETTIAAQNVYVQVTIFDTNGENNNVTPDHTNDHITIIKAGRYYISCSITLNSIGGSGSTAEMEVKKNNGDSRVGSLHVDRTLSGGGTESGAITITGIVNLAAPVSVTRTTYAFVDSNPDTITDSSNNFVNDGFLVGQKLTVTGTASNNGDYTIATVVVGTITLIASDTLAAESAGASMTLEGSETIEVWIKNETNTQNYVVEDITLSLFQIGG